MQGASPNNHSNRRHPSETPSLEDFDVPALLETLKEEFKQAHKGTKHRGGNISAETSDGLKIQMKPPGAYLFGGKRFCSRGEAAMDAALQKYVSSRYSYAPGESYEFPIGINENGNVQTVDFRIGDFLIEYHPPRFWTKKQNHGDFSSPKEAAEFKRLINSSKLSRKDKRYVRETMKTRLTENYTQRRSELIRSNPQLRHCKLIVVTDVQSLYEDVIKRFADTKLPGLDKFMDEFQSVASRVVDLSRSGRKRENARRNRRKERGKGSGAAYRKKNKALMRQATSSYHGH